MCAGCVMNKKKSLSGFMGWAVQQVFLMNDEIKHAPPFSAPDKVGGAIRIPLERNSTSPCPYLDCKLSTGSLRPGVQNEQRFFLLSVSFTNLQIQRVVKQQLSHC